MLPTELRDKTLVLLSQEGQVFLGWDYSIPLEAVSGYVAGQLLRIIDYDERSRILYLKPDGKAPEGGHLHTFNTYGQVFESMQVSRIEIRQPPMPVIKQITTASGHTQPISVKYRQSESPSFPPPPPAPPRSQPQVAPQQPIQFSENLTFDIRDAFFDDGKIRFEVKLKEMFQKVEVTISNPNVKKYFDAVKNYIYKLFGSRKTSCKVTFEFRERKCVPIAVDDCVLSNLDETILQKIHDGWVQQVVLSADRDEIISIDELVEPVRDENLNPDSVFNHIVSEDKTKHYHHLRYLSARQAIDLQKLSVTGKPLSFVFVIREKGVLFLIWETYLSQEATYIWKLSDASQLQHRYGLILEMRKVGRMVYRNKKESDFFYIEHQYKLPQKGFLKWKEEFEQIILSKPGPDSE